MELPTAPPRPAPTSTSVRLKYAESTELDKQKARGFHYDYMTSFQASSQMRMSVPEHEATRVAVR